MMTSNSRASPILVELLWYMHGDGGGSFWVLAPQRSQVWIALECATGAPCW
eukprot:CAMPEP_0202889676 /NCGR_PEP_ID=MMETSP1392-20130828/270_1 /ASSEMBLY_ACC=CAM_ASM_000868 /TAXON_ID=225041 /ORGANISM="Chlamydomonas chlamydogama, Strain SAG 11-48b" /LENGTH=50 /DNA_ID=CAMNT_0049573065 /DNA_START=1627 /DNA_END=1776 /DNA_ORIENTATION=+